MDSGLLTAEEGTAGLSISEFALPIESCCQFVGFKPF
jgi:hypothetical protein